MRVYLGGPIHGRTDAECRDWREEARRLLVGHEAVDPMRRDYRGREGECFREVVEGDKADIASCDVLLMHCPRPSVGTSMEILYGWERGKRVVAVAPEVTSPWLCYHAEAVFPSLVEAVEYLMRKEKP